MAVANATYESLNGAPHNLSREDLAAFQPPEYKFPFQTSHNPFYLGKQTSDWFRDWLLETEVDKVLSPEKFERILKADFPRLTSNAHPITGMGLWGYQWITKITGYLFILDDLVDGGEFGSDPKGVLSVTMDTVLLMAWSFPDDPRIFENIRTFFNMAYSGQEYEEKMEGIENLLEEARRDPSKAYPREIAKPCISFAEAWMDGLKRSAPSSMLLVAHYTLDSFMGLFQEAKTRQADMRGNSLQDHLEIRSKSGAIFIFVYLREIGSGLRTPSYWLESPPMVQALSATNDLAAWDNDINSLAKELLVDKDISCNILAAVSKCKSVTFGEATKILQKMMDQRLLDLEAALADLKKITPPELVPNLHIYTEGLHNVIIGCHDWFFESPRYLEY